VEIVQGREILLVTDDGQRRVRAPAPEPVIGEQHRRYHVITEDHELRVEIEDSPCYDTMSGERFEASVMVVLDGKRHQGCGREPG